MTTRARARLRYGLATILCGFTILGSPAGAQAPAGKAVAGKPAAADTAAGTLKVGATAVTLAHAYVAGPVSGVYIVELTDQPIPEAQLGAELRRGGGQGQLRSGKVQGLLLYVAPDGFVQTAIPFVGAMRGEKMLASVGPLVRFNVAGGQVSGVGSLSTEKTNQDWSYDAKFTATVRSVQ
jgi:hypothetical protein